MANRKHDPITGQKMTGHEWNGIEELETPVPRTVYFFLAISFIFSVGYWILMPAWPVGWTYTKGLLGIDQREVVTRQVENAAANRSVWTDRIASEDFATIKADDELMHFVHETGRTLFVDNCGVCHGVNGTGGPGYPDLTAGSWLWGGDPETLAETIRVGINSDHDETRYSEMMGFGRDGILSIEEVRAVTAYVRSLSEQELTEADRGRILAGGEIFADNCAACHGDGGKGMTEVGAPDLTDHAWIYGGDTRSVFNTIYSGRQGHMPHWQGRLSETDIRMLALYVDSFSGEAE